MANNTYPLGTEIAVSPEVFGRRYFRVEDRIGYGSEMDFYNPSCAASISFGRRLEHVVVVR